MGRISIAGSGCCPELGTLQVQASACAVQVTHNRLKATLHTLAQAPTRQGAPGAPLADVLFGARQPRFADAIR